MEFEFRGGPMDVDDVVDDQWVRDAIQKVIRVIAEARLPLDADTHQSVISHKVTSCSWPTVSPGDTDGEGGRK